MGKPSEVRVTGPLTAHADGFRAELIGQGYTPLSARNQLWVMAHLSRWLESKELEPAELTPVRVEEFLHTRRSEGYTHWLSERGVAPLLDYLRRLEVAPRPAETVDESPLDVFLASYRSYLVRERGLTETTIYRYQRVARLFLAARSDSIAVHLENLTAAEIAEFVLRECRRGSVAYASHVVTALRSLLRFLHLEGTLARPLVSAVPAVARWRGSSLPRALDPSQVARLLKSCDRRRAVGRRDYAILTLLVRLGLRVGEVAALGLDDIDWRAGDIVIRGKGRRQERLPLPADVGETVAAYLRRGRARIDCRALFLRARAPHGAMSAGAVRSVVRTACDRAGVPRVGAHRLRHTAATAMLRAGAPLEEIGQVLRHRNLATTAIYAKVDRDALRTIAQSWPGGAA